ncbi:MAG: hypothetical protein Q4G40_02730 [Brachybacterium sp.]|nr:hypothetical protein [Brachybacterium sp.]
MPSLRAASRRAPGVTLAALGAIVVVLAALLPLDAARADDADGSAAPVRLAILTSGLTWEDITADTPHLQCLVDRSGAGALNTSSVTPISTREQGSETIRTGYRGLAAEAPRTAGIPSPAVDRLDLLPGGALTLDARDRLDAGDVRTGLEDHAIVLVDAPSVDHQDRPADLAALDTRVGETLDAFGGCEAADLPRTLLVSVAATDLEDAGPAGAASRGGAAQLQVLTDSAHPHQALTSGSSHQSGIVILTDLLPTILASHEVAPDVVLPGQPLHGEEHTEPARLALDRSQAAHLVDGATAVALGSWMLPGAIGLIVLLTPLRRRARLAAAARLAMVAAPLALPVGLCASLVPWWRAEIPWLALTAVVWTGALALTVLVATGPWRRHRLGAPGVAGALIAGIILAESAAGSPLQLASPLGAQPISGGRFYGLSNHLAGMVLAGTMMALLAAFTARRGRRARTLLTLGVGVVVVGISVAPGMGADFGSMLLGLPAYGLLALLVSGIRPKLWHVLALGAGALAAVLAVSFADWLRPPQQRTHLGRFIDELLSGRLLDVVLPKISQNLGMLIGIWPLGLLVLLGAVVTVAMLMPRRAGLRRLAALDQQVPAAYAVRVALAVGAWIGYATNDTGPVLIVATLGVSLALWIPALPDPRPAPADARGAAGRAPAARP